ncbi:MAG: hypothetical protein J6Q89_03415 [Clostridia bacterium]|nr:hypothetical protein [Clostridia bacterium]
MKKFTLPFVIILSLILSCCATQHEPKDFFTLPISVSASLDGNGGQFSLDISEKECTVTFGDTHALSGTTLYFAKDGNTATVGDIFTRTIKNGTFPAQESLIKAIQLLASTETVGINEGDKTRYTIDEMKILVYYDENTDSITRIETEEGGRRFAFVIASLESHDTQSKSAGMP